MPDLTADCPMAHMVKPGQIQKMREKYEDIAVVCYINSTAELIDYVAGSPLDDFIICTEDGVDYKLITDNPEKKFYYPNPHPCCADMKLNTPQNILSVLEKEDKEVFVDEAVAANAWKPLDRMLELGR